VRERLVRSPQLQQPLNSLEGRLPSMKGKKGEGQFWEKNRPKAERVFDWGGNVMKREMSVFGGGSRKYSGSSGERESAKEEGKETSLLIKEELGAANARKSEFREQEPVDCTLRRRVHAAPQCLIKPARSESYQQRVSDHLTGPGQKDKRGGRKHRTGFYTVEGSHWGVGGGGIT